MVTYAINYMETYERTYFVKADSYDEAEEKLKNAIMEGEIDGPEYCVDSKYEDVTDCFSMEELKINNIENKTLNNDGIVINVALNYGGRDEMTKATIKIAEQVKNGTLNVEDINEQTISNNLYTITPTPITNIK